MPLPQASRDLVRSSSACSWNVHAIGGSLWILRPFLPAVIWATMIVVATWPFLLRVQSMLGGRRSSTRGDDRCCCS